MISSDNRRYAYGKSQLIEVICQLRFPTILSIDTREPADFQETVRAAFPRYQCQVEKLPGVNGAPARTVNNHTFISEDGGYKLSLTKDFIALSTMRYTHWEDFAARLDEPLGQFIKIYRPNCFDRVGLCFCERHFARAAWPHGPPLERSARSHRLRRQGKNTAISCRC